MPKSFPHVAKPSLRGRRENVAAAPREVSIPHRGLTDHITIYMALSMVLIPKTGVNSSVGRGRAGARWVPAPTSGHRRLPGTRRHGGKFPSKDKAAGARKARQRPGRPGSRRHRRLYSQLTAGVRPRRQSHSRTQSAHLFSGLKAPPALLCPQAEKSRGCKKAPSLHHIFWQNACTPLLIKFQAIGIRTKF